MTNEKKVITLVEQQKGNKKRFNIYLNEEYAFAVHEDVLVSFHLYKGKEIEHHEMELICSTEEENKAWQKALRYINYKWRTESEVRNHLLQLDYEPLLVSNIIQRLKKMEFINDQQYATSYIEQRIRHKPRGKKMMEYELKKKGVNSSDIESGLQNISQEIEFQMAFELLHKRLHRYRDEEWKRAKQKMGLYLQNKGFNMEIIHRVLEYYKENILGNNDL